MFDRIRGRHRVAWSVGLAALLIGFSLAPRTASAVVQTKNYSVTGPGGQAFAGVPQTVSVTLTNEGSSTQSFGSAEVTFSSASPPAVQALQTGLPTGWSAKVPKASPTSVLVTNQSGSPIAPNGTLTVEAQVTPSAAGTLTIATQVKQSNNFSGTGNNFLLDTNASSGLTITVIAVKLKFSQQPPSSIAQSLPGASPAFFADFCPAIAVEIDDSTGALVSAHGVPITVTYAGNANPGLYYQHLAAGAGGVTVETSSGIATFGTCSSGLSATVAGTGYMLSASSPAAATSVTSSSFDVTQTCSTACTTTATSQTTGTTGTVNAGDSTGVFQVTTAFGQGIQLNCDSAITAPGDPVDPLFVQTALLAGSGDVSGTITMVFPKAVVNSISNNGTPQFPVCAGAKKPFVALVTYQGSTSYPYQGLLFSCNDPAYAPGNELQLCVQSRAKVGGGAEQVVIFASNLSDPSFW